MDNGEKKQKEQKRKRKKSRRAYSPYSNNVFFLWTMSPPMFLLLCPKGNSTLVPGSRRGMEVQKCGSLNKKGLTSVLQLSAFTPQLVSVERKLENCFHIPLGSELEVRVAASFQRAETMGVNSLHRTGNWAHFCHLTAYTFHGLPHWEGGNNRKSGVLGGRQWNS